MEPMIDVVDVRAKDAAVKRVRVPMSEIPRGIMPAVSEVWRLLREGAVPSHGHNVWIYRHRQDAEVDVEVGVELNAPFTERDGLVMTKTPSGRAAHAVHLGDYSQLKGVHAAVMKYCRDQGLTLAGVDWEVYDDPNPDPTKTRTDVYHLLK